MSYDFGVAEVVAPNDNLILSNYPLLVAQATLVSGAGALKRGQLLGAITASGKYDVYDDGDATGLEDADAVLWEDSDATSADSKCSIIVSGHLRASAIIGYDAAAKSDLRTRGIYVE